MTLVLVSACTAKASLQTISLRCLHWAAAKRGYSTATSGYLSRPFAVPLAHNSLDMSPASRPPTDPPPPVVPHRGGEREHPRRPAPLPAVPDKHSCHPGPRC